MQKVVSGALVLTDRASGLLRLEVPSLHLKVEETTKLSLVGWVGPSSSSIFRFPGGSGIMVAMLSSPRNKISRSLPALMVLSSNAGDKLVDLGFRCVRFWF